MPNDVALFGGSFNPPGEHHRAIASALGEHFGKIIVIPCGPRPDKPVTNDVAPVFRAAMADLAFGDLPKVTVDLFDLEANTFTRTHDSKRKYAALGKIWHIVGADCVQNGAKGQSFIQKSWKEGASLWKNAHFAVVKRPAFPLGDGDLPPNHRIFEIEKSHSSSAIRDLLFRRQDVGDLVSPVIQAYIERHGLYHGFLSPRTTALRLPELRPLVVVDTRNPEAIKCAAALPPSSPDPNLILVVGGDGAMLRAIRQHWRLRIPFYGINAGHIGFLMNQKRELLLPGKELSLQHLPLLHVEIEDPEGRKTSDVAFNDAWIERETGQTAWMKIRINGVTRLEELVGDGLLVSTAAGSASYARAMGAPPLPLNSPALLLVGSNVLRPMGWKSAVLPLDSEIEAVALDFERRPIRGFIDGTLQEKVKALRVRVSRIASAELAFEPEFDPGVKLARLQFPV